MFFGVAALVGLFRGVHDVIRLVIIGNRLNEASFLLVCVCVCVGQSACLAGFGCGPVWLAAGCGIVPGRATKGEGESAGQLGMGKIRGNKMRL